MSKFFTKTNITDKIYAAKCLLQGGIKNEILRTRN